MTSPLMFTSGHYYALPFWAATCLWGIPEVVGQFRQQSSSGSAGRDRGSQVVLVGSLWISVFLGFALAWNLPGATITALRPAVFYLAAELGRPYEEYMRRTHRFVPFVF